MNFLCNIESIFVHRKRDIETRFHFTRYIIKAHFSPFLNIFALIVRKSGRYVCRSIAVLPPYYSITKRYIFNKYLSCNASTSHSLTPYPPTRFPPYIQGEIKVKAYGLSSVKRHKLFLHSAFSQ